MKAGGQLPTPEAAATRVLAYLARADSEHNRSPTCATPENPMNDTAPPAPAPAAGPADENQIIAERRAKLAALRADGPASQRLRPRARRRRT